MSSSTGLALALLVIYITLSLPAIYVAVKHGLKHGAIVGWFFLFTFCTHRIIASALECLRGSARIMEIGTYIPRQYLLETASL
ncbi:hypothetical protein F4781DRAFT_389755 [Annulohypoxylon bovei var. microspora]|nr:hypothetical protein F4781DRAFT_389755 [Annulohypoxylon bovei var. microspora]